MEHNTIKQNNLGVFPPCMCSILGSHLAKYFLVHKNSALVASFKNKQMNNKDIPYMYLFVPFWALELDMLSQFPSLLGLLLRFFVEDHKLENIETNPVKGIK